MRSHDLTRIRRMGRGGLCLIECVWYFPEVITWLIGILFGHIIYRLDTCDFFPYAQARNFAYILLFFSFKLFSYFCCYFQDFYLFLDIKFGCCLYFFLILIRYFYYEIIFQIYLFW